MPLCAIVTGSSSGIGRAVAQRLSQDGFSVLLADVQREPLTGGEPTDEIIKSAGGNGEFLESDVSKREDCERLVALAGQKFGGLHVLVNNAAIAGAHSKPFLKPPTRIGTGSWP
jgi:NAD(P)-dependent dehydrogenase (short-subunit alcohol dehydrogenase family)